MNLAVGRVVAAGVQALFRLTVGELLAPGLEPVRGARIDRLAQLLQYRLAVDDEGLLVWVMAPRQRPNEGPIDKAHGVRRSAGN